ncbi:copine-8 isoform X2 [Lingula anatina]|uniref:Copine-8 isoform X2 n=1 Tax=Lingula anatina TaxID=7574 RepID=A0A1S3K4N2_LINAN|nr:copine-8 isoform X2 [Lingula anatina]|eukprot:XP_013417379.1 copine-8 isoform X2 [Lingula anatina]
MALQMSTGGFQPGAGSVPATQVELTISCRNLKDKDVLSKSDPMCVLFVKGFGSNSYTEYGRTEIIQNTLNPEFVQKFLINYFFEESQKLKFEIYDSDSASARLDAHDFLGRIECTLGEIVSATKIDKPLTGLSGNCGHITVRAEEVSQCKEIATMQFRAHKLDKKDFFGKSDPFLVFYRCNEDSSYSVVHKTEVIKNTLDPTWRPFTVPVRSLCNGDYDRSIKVECYDWDSDGSHDIIGEFQTNIRELSHGPVPNNVYEVINKEKKAKKKSYKNSGRVELMSCSIVQEYTFLDYVQHGTEMNFTVAIDFTASNGDPRSATSLHYLNPYGPNQYATALQAVGEIIQEYDSDKMFPALGFGARLPPDGRVSHEFFLNGQPNNPYCQGIEGVMQAYYQALSTVQLYGPTNFAPVINHVARFAETYKDGSNYFVLLILTDGVITDMPYTKDAIIHASVLPMSIIIVGVGDADFSAMEELDSDNQRLQSHGRYAERDIVQFVPIRQFLSAGQQNVEMTKARLAKEVLAEIPEQFISFMKKHGIQPKMLRGPPQQ